ncbi:hypothetical protein BRADI_4g20986v3 [Brachypodium distachyon]|uniref:CCHC-type domain-containing protein n=1 Tax=Brachypodium distachyon TaxID=15368 RepID=A0A2K2CP41_BRADI|nr:hypothetical protein BRADI_4g20986v3 [Brachypodium distachyon]
MEPGDFRGGHERGYCGGYGGYGDGYGGGYGSGLAGTEAAMEGMVVDMVRTAVIKAALLVADTAAVLEAGMAVEVFVVAAIVMSRSAVASTTMAVVGVAAMAAVLGGGGQQTLASVAAGAPVAQVPAATSLLAGMAAASSSEQVLVTSRSGAAMATATVAAASASDGAVSNPSNPLSRYRCFRCDQKGHLSTMCTTILCDFCEKADHCSADCELPKLPKLSVRSCGTLVDDLFFFEFPEEASVPPKVESNRKGLVRVECGVLPLERLIGVMERLIPVPNFQWVVRPQGMSDFSVVFPTREEGEEWTLASIAAFQFQRAWVRIGNIQDDLFNYHAIWGLGSLLGTTIEVDMPFSRQHEVGRISVDVTNKRAIPPGTDLGHKGVGYRLTFQVESSADSDMGDDNSSNDDDDMLDDMKDLDNRKDDDTRKRSRPTPSFQRTEGVTEPSSAPPAFNAGAPTIGLIFRTGRSTGTGYLSPFKLLGDPSLWGSEALLSSPASMVLRSPSTVAELAATSAPGQEAQAVCPPAVLSASSPSGQAAPASSVQVASSAALVATLCRKRRRPLCVLLCRDGRHHLVGPWQGSWASTRVALCRRHLLHGMACSSLLSAWRRCRRQPTWRAWRSLRRGLHRLRRCYRRRRIRGLR